MNRSQYDKSKFKKDIKDVALACKALRSRELAVDVSLAEFVQAKWNVSMEAFYEDLGINLNQDTIRAIFTLPDDSIHWLIPEIIRDALRLGLRKAPIWSDLIVAEQQIANPKVQIPHWNMSDATPKIVGEGETITQGALSFGQKELKIRKIGRGIRTTYETINYVTANVIAIFLQDFGVKLNHGIDSLLIDTLINGEQADGSESAPVVGVENIGTFTYRDLLRVWVRMARIGRTPFAIIGGETAAIDTLNLDEFKKRYAGTTQAVLDLKTPIPASAAYFIHGMVEDNQQIVIDRTAAVIKYNAQPLLVEDQKIISNQTLETYASLTTGFGVLYRDARVIVDKSLAFADNGFPSYMDVDPLENVSFED